MSDWIRDGALFRLPEGHLERRIVLADLDAGVVAYDTWRPDLDAWAMADLAAVRRRAVSYYVVTVDTALATGEPVRDDPLSPDEEELHRPDLPFTLLADDRATWGDGSPDVSSLTVETAALWVVPHGPRGGKAKGVRVEAAGAHLDGPTLMTEAAAAVAAARGPDVHGVGLHRLGLHRGVPSSYAWGARTRLEDARPPARPRGGGRGRPRRGRGGPRPARG